MRLFGITLRTRSERLQGSCPSAPTHFRGRIYDNLLETIGATPLVRLSQAAPRPRTCKAEILGKLEFFNPLASVKDRIGLAMIEELEDKGVLKAGLGHRRADLRQHRHRARLRRRRQGLSLILTMPESMSMERRKMLRLLGAELELTPAARGMSGAIARAEELAEGDPERHHPAAVQEPGQSGDPSPHHRGGDLEG